MERDELGSYRVSTLARHCLSACCVGAVLRRSVPILDSWLAGQTNPAPRPLKLGNKDAIILPLRTNQQVTVYIAVVRNIRLDDGNCDIQVQLSPPFYTWYPPPPLLLDILSGGWFIIFFLS